MKLLEDMEINLTLKDIAKIKRHPFKKIVNKHIQKASFKYLLSKVKSKGKEIKYGTVLKCQGYLMPNLILTLEEQLKIFTNSALLAELVLESPCPSVCLSVCHSVCLCHRVQFFSKPLIGPQIT